MTVRRPRILLLADARNWAFDFIARSLKHRLRRQYDVSICYTVEEPDLRSLPFDLLYIFYWGAQWHRQFNITRERIVKEVASLRWCKEERFGFLSPQAFAAQYLDDCGVVATPAASIYELIQPHHERVFVCPNGYEPSVFRAGRLRRGKLRIGWVGNPEDETKGLYDYLLPACGDRFDFRYSNGQWSRRRIARFYREIDVLAIASLAESQPLPLMESMASGCFPVSTNVGIVPELVRDQVNGLVVDRSIEAFQTAFTWCEANLDFIRRQGELNALLMRRLRDWDRCADRFGEIFDYALALQLQPTAAAPSNISVPADISAIMNQLTSDDSAHTVSFTDRCRAWSWFAQDSWVRWSAVVRQLPLVDLACRACAKFTRIGKRVVGWQPAVPESRV